MKGLLVKDFQILRNQGRILFMLAGISLLLGFTSENSSFIIGYCTFCLSALVTTTVTYDDFDNGYAFLFSLPVTRKMYVWEKYILALMISILASGLSVVVTMGISALKGSGFNLVENLLIAAVVCMLSLMMLSVMLPIQMKFGAEKTRIILFGLVGGVLALGYLITLLIEKLQATGTLNEDWLQGILENLGGGVMIVIALFLVVVVMAVAMGISIRVMEKKQM